MPSPVANPYLMNVLIGSQSSLELAQVLPYDCIQVSSDSYNKSLYCCVSLKSHFKLMSSLTEDIMSY